MTVQPMWPDHLLGLEEWDALPEDNSRHYELADGVLIVSPRAVPRHQLVAMLLAAQLHSAADGRWHAIPDVEVVIDDGPAATVRAPDVVVLDPAFSLDAPRCVPSDVLATVEVLSPGSRRLDRIVKLHEYAEVGVRWYLLVDPGPPVTLVEFELDGGTYTRVDEHSGRAPLRLGATLDLVALER